MGLYSHSFEFLYNLTLNDPRRWDSDEFFSVKNTGVQILDHIEAQPPPLKPATAIQSYNTLGLAGQNHPARPKNLLSDQLYRV